MAGEHILLDNRTAFLREVLLTGPVTRGEISARLGLNKATASRIARSFIDAGLIQERPQMAVEGVPAQGRPSRALAIDPQGGQVLGICVTPTVQTVALADIGQNVIGSTEFAFDSIDDPEQTVRHLAMRCRQLIGAHLRDRNRLLGGTLLITAQVDSATESVLAAPYLGWDQFPLRRRLAELLDLTTHVRMLTPTIGQVERLFGVVRGRENLLVLLCGAGTGAAVLLNGRLVGSSAFPTGGIGAMKVTDEDGTVTTLDELVGGVAILRRLHRTYSAQAPLSQIHRSLRDAIKRDRMGDAQVSAHIRRTGHKLGRLVAQYGHLMRPETVLISGPLAMSPSYMAGVRECLNEDMELPVRVAASRITGAEDGWWLSCSAAIYEYLIEQPSELLESWIPKSR